MVFRCGWATKNLHTAFDYIFNSTNKDTVCGKILGQWTKLSNGKITGGCPPNANDVVTNMEMMNKFVSNLFRHQKYLANTEVKRLLLGSIFYGRIKYMKSLLMTHPSNTKRLKIILLLV